MPRKRIGDGPSPEVLGRLLLALVRRAENQAWDGVGSGATAAELASVLELSATHVRTYAAELARARCVRISRAPTARHQESGRYAQAFYLPPLSEEHGPARAPRLYAVALIVASTGHAADQIGYALREMSMVPVAVSATDTAIVLLEHLGFELVLVQAPASRPRDGVAWFSELVRLRDAARQAGCGPFLVLGQRDAGGHIPPVGLGMQAVLPGPGDRRHLRSALADALSGPNSHGMDATFVASGWHQIPFLPL